MLAIEYVDRAVERFPHRVAVTDGELAITWGEMGDIVDRIARALVANGVRPGTHIAILSFNHPMVLACQYAILRAGCVWVPANPRNPAPDTAQQFAKLDVKWLFHHSGMEDYLDSVRGELAGIEGTVPIDAPSRGREEVNVWAASFTHAVTLPAGDMDDVIWIGSTGGTTSGQMKGAVHTNRSWEINLANFYVAHPFKAPPVHLVVAPLTHAAGVFHWGLMGREATHVICPSADPEMILSMIERHRATILFLPPTIIYMLLAHPRLQDFDLSSLEFFGFGAAPMSVEKLKEAVAVFGPCLYQAYGSTETLILNAYLTREELADAAANPARAHRLASIGREGPFSRIGIMDEEGALLPAGERGEIVMRSGSVLREYYKDPERTAQSRLFGWHHTGDIGYKDEDGFVYLVDRKNDMIITGGFNVYPAEIEQVVLAHPSVQDCAVVGVPDEKWGEMVIAAVELKAGAAFDSDAFLAFCRERVGGVKAPKRVEVLDIMPRSPVGKTLRRVVRDRFWTGRDRQIS